MRIPATTPDGQPCTVHLSPVMGRRGETLGYHCAVSAPGSDGPPRHVGKLPVRAGEAAADVQARLVAMAGKALGSPVVAGFDVNDWK